MAHTSPTPADLKTKFPAFAAVQDATVQVWLDEAAVECSAFPDNVRASAEMLYAAAKMAEGGIGAAGPVPAGMTSFKSADFSANISERIAARVGWESTSYGRDFAKLRQRYFGGPLLLGPACV